LKHHLLSLFIVAGIAPATTLTNTFTATSTLPPPPLSSISTSACIAVVGALPQSCTTSVPGIVQSTGADFNVLAALDPSLSGQLSATPPASGVASASTLVQRTWQDPTAPSTLDFAISSQLGKSTTSDVGVAASSSNRVDRIAFQTDTSGNFISSFGLVYSAVLNVSPGSAAAASVDFNSPTGQLKVSAGDQVSGAINILFNRFDASGSFTDRLFSLAFNNGLVTDAFSATPITLPTIGSVAVFEVGIPNLFSTGQLSFLAGLPISQRFTTQQFVSAAEIVAEPSTTLAGLFAIVFAFALKSARQSTAPPAIPAIPATPAPAHSMQTHHRSSNTASS
jgi:hypothetical protein